MCMVGEVVMVLVAAKLVVFVESVKVVEVVEVVEDCGGCGGGGGDGGGSVSDDGGDSVGISIPVVSLPAV